MKKLAVIPGTPSIIPVPGMVCSGTRGGSEILPEVRKIYRISKLGCLFVISSVDWQGSAFPGHRP